LTPNNNDQQDRAPSDSWKWKGKSLWKGKDEEQVNVETRALQYYENMGFKGFVCLSSFVAFF
jgi:Fanconi-associated nuclease 1